MLNYFRKNRDQRNAYAREWQRQRAARRTEAEREKRREYMRDYRNKLLQTDDGRRRLREYQKRAKAKQNPEHVRASRRAYRISNAEKIRIQRRQQRQRRTEKQLILERAARRRRYWKNVDAERARQFEKRIRNRGARPTYRELKFSKLLRKKLVLFTAADTPKIQTMQSRPLHFRPWDRMHLNTRLSDDPRENKRLLRRQYRQKQRAAYQAVREITGNALIDILPGHKNRDRRFSIALTTIQQLEG